MSYILEALKRLEKKHREGLPTLLTLQGDLPERKRRRPLWLYLILAALLLNAGITLLWIAPWRPAQESAGLQPAVPAEMQTQPIAKTTVPPEKPVVQTTIPAPAPAERKEPVVTDTPKENVQKQVAAPQASVTEKKPVDKIPPKSAPAKASPSTDSRAPATSTPAPSSKVVSLQDLPPAVKSSLPDLKISTHYYSDEPRSRLVRVNDTTLREGDVLNPPGLKVEEITPTHILFVYQGYRFTVAVNGR